MVRFEFRLGLGDRNRFWFMFRIWSSVRIGIRGKVQISKPD